MPYGMSTPDGGADRACVGASLPQERDGSFCLLLFGATGGRRTAGFAITATHAGTNNQRQLGDVWAVPIDAPVPAEWARVAIRRGR